MHYLLSTKQVGPPVPDSSRKPRGSSPDRDKVAGWMGPDLLKRYHKDTTSSSISGVSVVLVEYHGPSVTASQAGSHCHAGEMSHLAAV